MRALLGVAALTLTLITMSAETQAQSVDSPLSLKDCGRVVGHEMGLWDFFSLSPGPSQVKRVLRSQLKFVKISLQKLADNTWVVAHDPTFVVSHHGVGHRYQFSEVTREDILKWRSSPDFNTAVYFLSEYIGRDQGKLCWMLSPKQHPNDELIFELMHLSATKRTLLLTRSLEELQWYDSLPAGLNLHYAARISNPADFETFKKLRTFPWIVEIEKSAETADLITRVHALGYGAYVDSMGYSKNYELLGTKCREVFSMKADMTQTNRPLQCLKLIQ